MEQFPQAQENVPVTPVVGATPVAPIPSPMPTPADTSNASIPPVDKPTNKNKMILIIFAVVLILTVVLIALYFLVFKGGSSKPTYNTLPVATLSPTIIPTATPISSSNADQTLTDTDASIQQSVDQVNTDLTTLNSTNAQQDNPNTF